MFVDDPITGLVARVVDDYSVVINVGRNGGVSKRMRFAVVDPLDETITDPESGEVLGTVPRVKILVEARDVFEKMTICKTYVEKTVGGGVGVMFGPEKTVLQRIHTEEEVIDPETYNVESGDRVVQIEG